MDWKEVEKYRAIRYGGLRVLVWMALSVLAGTGFGFFLEKAISDPNIAWQSAGCLSVVVLLVGVLVFRANNYWRRNVWGYVLWCWRDDKGEVQWAIGQTALHELAIGLALGGWFRRSRTTCSAVTFREGVNSKEMLSQWRVKLVRIHTNTGAIIVRLTDRCGDRVTVNAKDALEILERFSARLEALTNTWDAVVRHGLIAERVRTEERDEAKKRAEEFERKWKTACQQREDALSTIAEAIGRIDATRRFIKSDQAQTVRAWLNGRLAAMAPVGAPGTMLGARETLTQPAACAIVGFGR